MSAVIVAKLFRKGRSQAVRIPTQFRFDVAEVYVRKVGDQVILSPKAASWDDFLDRAPHASDDFMRERPDLPA
ncbi:MAG: antitoxin [Bryobacteraceae bacterium]